MSDNGLNLSATRIHPFFKGHAPSASNTPPVSHVHDEALEEIWVSDDISSAVASQQHDQNSPKRKRRKTTTDIAQEEPLDQKKQRGRRKKTASLGPAVAGLPTLEDNDAEPIDSDIASVEKDATTTPVTLETSETSETVAAISAALRATSANVVSSTQPILLGSEDTAKQRSEINSADSTKVLKFNPKTGTLGSPPTPKQMSRIVRLKYGSDDESKRRIGQRIEKILAADAGTGTGAGEGAQAGILRKRGRPRKKALETSGPAPMTVGDAPPQQIVSDSGPPSPPKSTHPFFTRELGKGLTDGTEESKEKEKTDSNKTAPARKFISMVAPRSPCRPRMATGAGGASLKMAQFGVKSGALRVAGACHPMWPPQEMAHVRGLHAEHPAVQRKAAEGSSMFTISVRKSKGQEVTIAWSEDVLRLFEKRLRIDDIRNEETTELVAHVPGGLRLPLKVLESGRKLRRRISRELRSKCCDVAISGDDDDSSPDPVTRTAHPAVSRLYGMLETNLSAYDQSDCENVSWAQKYAPNSSAEVLQNGRECAMLRDWLETLKVQAVDTGVVELPMGKKGLGDGGKVGPRKKRRRNKLDGFVVSSDDETNEMGEVSEEIDEDWAGGGGESVKKTVIRGKEMVAKGSRDCRRLANAIVLSGPHGCGKTATVYAVAKELDFEVFEINSSSRRSGKDIMEKVGDMTRNHLVQQHNKPDQGPQPGRGSDEHEAYREMGRDTGVGKAQGTMLSFFQPKDGGSGARTKSKKAGKGPLDAAATTTTTAAALEERGEKAKTQAKMQKQSLILVEEVDVLFEEDKQFWATLVGMMSQSKRPFVLTCTDETPVPLQGLNLHGIFRFMPPPVDAAVDVLLLAAANEGHSLRRAAVASLYESRSRDLRACLAELNFWCQMGVGDRRGGFDWFYTRWPKGCDVDDKGDVVRVVSDETYLAAMGWYPRDVLCGSTTTQFEVEEELGREVWTSWQVDLASQQAANAAMSWATTVSRQPAATRAGVVSVLQEYEEFCDSMSAADLCSSGGHGAGHQELMDYSLPEMTARAGEDYIVGLQLLDATPLQHQCPINLEIATGLKVLSRAALDSSATAAMATLPSTVSSSVSLSTAGLEKDARRAILDSVQSCQRDGRMTRHALSMAFDPIAIADKAASQTSAVGYLDPSVFDRTLQLIVLDVTPYVRGIVSYDQRLMRERLLRSNLLSEGGGDGGGRLGKKRMRSTRSALSALEGGSRQTTRREKYFTTRLNGHLVLKTAASGWEEAAISELRGREEVAAAYAAATGVSEPREKQGTAMTRQEDT